jgi:hypothetical protein
VFCHSTTQVVCLQEEEEEKPSRKVLVDKNSKEEHVKPSTASSRTLAEHCGRAARP